ncbi:MAG TPA: DHA2 family efflux MFS transporter permease subunit [Burkholderiales bacterium]|nr:DHA2 family efflux MFS transporter permease subunit [Burkholderiales bacterium]
MNLAAGQRPRHPLLISGSVMVASLLYSIDWTIAAVALPHMQGTFSATHDQVAWVITSYIVASAIMIPTSGWLSTRFGRKLVFVCAVAAFTLASVFCGAANSLPVEVLARIAQGMSGAFLIPLSLAIILDTFPPEQHAKAMSYWGIGSVCGAVMGPTLGGYLTEYLSWRYIFYINVPFGLIALLGVVLFLPETERDKTKKLDWFGFLTLAIGIGALQMMLDRGQRLDWFESGEIIFEACLAAISLYMFNMHVMTHREPFLDPRLFVQRNFFIAMVLISFYGLLTVPPMVMMPAFLEQIRGYSIDTVGLLQSPRGVGILLALFISGRVSGRVDPRLLIFFGLLCLGISTGAMAFWNVNVDTWSIVWTGFIQGIGAGVILVPVQMCAFALLPPLQRNEGTAVFNLVRTMFSSIGVSITLAVFVYVGATGRAELVEHITPYSQALQYLDHSGGYTTGTEHGLAVIGREIDKQASMLGYNASFLMLALGAFVAMPLVLLIGRAKPTNSEREGGGFDKPEPFMIAE